MLIKKYVDYKDQDTKLEGYVAFNDEINDKKPLVLVAHDWSGRNEFANTKAEQLAELGCVGFAIDMFGKGKLGKTKEEKMALIDPLMKDRNMLANRIRAAFDFGKNLEQVNEFKTAAIGFCFGGLCVLDLARSGADVTGVVSFHGLLNPPPSVNKKISAKILALHGYDDPMVTPDVVNAFEKEMTESQVDWQLHVFGNTMHAFTNPEANDPSFGTVYNAQADKRSWVAMKNFLQEIFGSLS